MFKGFFKRRRCLAETLEKLDKILEEHKAYREECERLRGEVAAQKYTIEIKTEELARLTKRHEALGAQVRDQLETDLAIKSLKVLGIIPDTVKERNPEDTLQQKRTAYEAGLLNRFNPHGGLGTIGHQNYNWGAWSRWQP